MRNYRPLIMGRRGAVASNHPLSTQAGLDILRAGGNAVDAAVATSLTLGVVEPNMSGLGGDGFYHAFMAQTGEAKVFNGTGSAPAAATRERYARGMPASGPLSVSTPGALGGVAAMHATYGRLPWARVCERAIEHARDGYAVTHTYRRNAQEMRDRISADARSRSVFLRDGEVLSLATVLRQPDLARTLEEVAAEGAEGFYRGRLAKRLAAGMHDAGVLVSAADLEACRPDVQEPIAVTYRGYTVTQTPPNSMGFVLLQMLKTVEQFDLKAMDPAQRIHVLVEAKKRAFLDRERYGSDPRHAPVPLERLLSESLATDNAAAIDLNRAADLPINNPEKADGDTTYFCVVDADGSAVSAIQSHNSAFGSGVIAGDTGVLLNNRMSTWHRTPGHPNQLLPGKRVRHTMNAPMVFRDGRLWGVLGTPGADNQVQINLQMLVAMIDLGDDPQAAVEAPRWSSGQRGQPANWPHGGNNALTVESDFSPEILAGLEQRGHVIERVAPLAGPCSVQIIRVTDEGVRMAGSDPRRDGWAGAY
jgi:gamma-glutamyltranspeptidase/glutathione hydrolase